MFEIGFSELLLVVIVGLLVVGPERLPTLIRTTARWMGALRRHVNQIRADFERELGVPEIRNQIRNDAIMAQFEDSANASKDAAHGRPAPDSEEHPPEDPNSKHTGA